MMKNENIIQVIKELLEKDQINGSENFFELGGNSLKALLFTSKVENLYDIKISTIELYQQATLDDIVFLIKKKIETKSTFVSSKVFYLNKYQYNRANMFLIPPVLGTSVLYTRIKSKFKDNYNLIGLEYPGFENVEEMVESIDEMVIQIYKEIKNIQNQGQFNILGYSMGGLISFEIAKLIEADLNTQTNIFLIDSYSYDMLRENKINSIQQTVEEILKVYKEYFCEERSKYFKSFIWNNLNLIRDYKVKGKIEGNIFALEAENSNSDMCKWSEHTLGKFTLKISRSNHFSIIDNLCFS